MVRDGVFNACFSFPVSGGFLDYIILSISKASKPAFEIQSHLARNKQAASESRAIDLEASKQSLGSTTESSCLKSASQAASIQSKAVYLKISSIRI